MRIRAIGIILKNNEVILIHRNVAGKEYFVFPGGGVEGGETIEQAVVREAYEETGVRVNVEKLLYTIIDENSEHNFYICHYLSGDLKREQEIEESNHIDSKIPSWNKIDNLYKIKILPLEIRDWFIEDFRSNFTKPPKTLDSLVSERRTA